MKLTKMTLSAMILFVLTLICCITISFINKEIFEREWVLFVTAPTTIIFLINSISIGKSDFNLEGFTLKRKPLKYFSFSLAVIIVFLLTSTILNLISPNIHLLFSIAGFIAQVCIITVFITFYQISLTFSEIMAVTADKILFFTFIVLVVATFALERLITTLYADLAVIMLMFVLPAILLFLKAFRYKKAFLPNFLMSMSFFVFFAISIIWKITRISISTALVVFSLSLTLVIIAIDQAKEIAKSVESDPELSLDKQTVIAPEEK